MKPSQVQHESSAKEPMSYFDMMIEAQQAAQGFQATFWLAYGMALLLALILFVLAICLNIMTFLYLFVLFDETVQAYISGSSIIMYALTVFWFALITPLILSLRAGIWMMCLKRVTHQPYDRTMIYAYFDTKLKLFLSFVFIISLFCISGALVFILPKYFVGIYTPIGFFLQGLGCASIIYFFFAYCYHTLLIVDKKLSTWRALEASRSRFTKNILDKLKLGYKNNADKLYSDTMKVQDKVKPSSFLVTAFSVIFTIQNKPYYYLLTCIMYREYFGASVDNVTTIDHQKDH